MNWKVFVAMKGGASFEVWMKEGEALALVGAVSDAAAGRSPCDAGPAFETADGELYVALAWVAAVACVEKASL